MYSLDARPASYLHNCPHSQAAQSKNKTTASRLPVLSQTSVKMNPAKLILFLSAVLTAGSTPATPPPQEEKGGCEWKGQHYQEGDTFHPDRCHTCVCHDGTVQCTTPGCPPTPCPNPVPDPHRCGCPSCPHGESW